MGLPAIDLSATHIHLLLNHVPTVGFAVALLLLVIGLIGKSDHLKLASLVTMVGISLIIVPLFVTGSAAQQRICVGNDVPGPCPSADVSRTLIEVHEGAAFAAMNLILVVGGVAWLGLWQYRRLKYIPTWNIVTVLIMSLVAFVAVAQAANYGGEIRHPEIRVGRNATAVSLARTVGNYVHTTPFAFAAAEQLHFIGFTVLMGVVILINMKVLGFLPGVPYLTLDRLLPWGILGYGLQAYTGMLFFVSASYQYVGNPAFYWKLGFLVVAGLNTLFFTFDGAWTRDGQPAPTHSKVLAVTAFGLWAAVMYWGSMLPFIGQAF